METASPCEFAYVGLCGGIATPRKDLGDACEGQKDDGKLGGGNRSHAASSVLRCAEHDL